MTGRDGTVTCRFTHVYPDGPCLYFTFGGLFDPTKDALQQFMVDFQMLRDAETGIEVAFKHVANGDTGQETMGFEISFGVGVGETAAAKLIQAA